MQIELSEDVLHRLKLQAADNGFASAEAYATDLLSAYAELVVDANSTAALDASVAALQDSLTDVEAGRTKDFREAMHEMARKLNLPLNR